MVPEAGYELRPIAVEGLSRSNPLKAARAALQGRGGGGRGAADPARRAPRRGARRRRLRRRPGRARGGGPARADRAGRGRQPSGPDQPPARAVGAARVPGLPDRRARGRALPRHRAPGPAAGDRSRRRPRALRPGAGRHLRARLRRLAGRAHDQRGGGAGAGRRRRSASCTPAARATTRRCARGSVPSRRPTTTCASSSRRSARRSLASDLCVARAGGSIFEIAAHGRPAILVPYPHASADHQSSNARWMAQAGAAVVVADAELTPERLASEVRRAAGRSRAAGGDGTGVGVAGAARRRSADRRGGARRRGAVSGPVVGARGGRTEREGHDDDQGVGRARQRWGETGCITGL